MTNIAPAMPDASTIDIEAMTLQELEAESGVVAS
jgi:hypothetical protein